MSLIVSSLTPTTPLQACRRFDWERVIRRAVLPQAVRFLALILATYADQDGAHVRPGNVRLVAVTGMSLRTVVRHTATLRDLGLLEKLTNGGGPARRAADYRLTIPEDLLERVELLDPDEGTAQTAGIRVIHSLRTHASQVAEVPHRDPSNSRHDDGASSGSDDSQLTPTGTELTPKQALTHANDPPVTSNDVRHQKTNQRDQPARDLGANPHQELTPRSRFDVPGGPPPPGWRHPRRRPELTPTEPEPTP